MSDRKDYLGLTVAERLALVEEIWDSIAAEGQRAPVSAARRQELARRAAEDAATPDAVIPWEEVKAQTLARLQKP